MLFLPLPNLPHRTIPIDSLRSVADGMSHHRMEVPEGFINDGIG